MATVGNSEVISDKFNLERSVLVDRNNNNNNNNNNIITEISGKN
jgi:hypothetical protein